MESKEIEAQIEQTNKQINDLRGKKSRPVAPTQRGQAGRV